MFKLQIKLNKHNEMFVYVCTIIRHEFKTDSVQLQYSNEAKIKIKYVCIKR